MSSGEFNSLLSEITGAPPPQRPNQTNLTARPRSSDAPQSPAIRSVSPLKRKPEDVAWGPPQKAAKPDLQRLATNNASRPGSSSGLAPKAAGLSLNRNAQGLVAKPAALGSKPGTPNSGSTPTSATTPKTHPKNSYRDLIAKARAKGATQATQPQPAVQTPPIQKRRAPLGRRKQERMEARQRARQAAKEGRDPSAAAGQAGVATSQKGKGTGKQPLEVPVKPKKERPPLEYKGTMRGSGAPGSKPTSSKQGVFTSRKKAGAGYSSASGSEMEAPDVGRRYRYASYSAEEDEEEEQEDDYDDEESDGMEGGGFDALEAEEEASLRAARKEDAEALRQEEAHRKEKMDRKSKLEALAAKAKRPKY